MSPYLRRTYLLPEFLEDDLAAELWVAGTLGVQSVPQGSGRIRLDTWFTAPAPDLTALEARWRPRGLELLGGAEEPERDWLAAWREQARPMPAGKGFLVDPREPEDAASEPAEVPAGRRLLRLPARRAFGTGSHESTLLALALVEESFARRGAAGTRRVLDVGTGTGVLAFAARLLGGGAVVAFDTDLQAVVEAQANARLNGLPLHLFAGGAEALAEPSEKSGSFDLVVVNILPERILPAMPQLARRLAPGGELILSGLLAEGISEIAACLAELGLAVAGRRREGEWAALRAGRREGAGARRVG